MYLSGLQTGLMGFSLKKEMMGDALFFRETATFRYELYSADFIGQSRSNITSLILNQFQTKYSGDINVKVFDVPTEYQFPNDTIRVGKFDVEVQVKSVPAVGTWQPELSSAPFYYKGLDANFFVGSGKQLLDFRESFDFEQNENGTLTFGHSLSFGLMTGSKGQAVGIASGIFAQDKGNSFGIASMVGAISTLADPTQYVNYYTETYDQIRQQYSFTRKREVLPSGAATYNYNIINTLDVKEDGFMDVSEKGNVKGNIDFGSAQAGMETLIAGAYSRCNSFYGTYVGMAADGFTYPTATTLVNLPIKTVRMFNPRGISADYDISFTNNQQFGSDGTQTNETFEIQNNLSDFVDLKHTVEFVYNKRYAPANTFQTLINAAVANSPAAASGYFAAVVTDPTYGYNQFSYPIHNIKKEVAWPNRKNKGARVVMTYANHPKYFVAINGYGYRVLDIKINTTVPTDIVTEYKVINRPQQTTVMNYAYQTERATMSITMDASIGRNPDEFVTQFRTDLPVHVANLYQYACGLFFNQFQGTIPVAFTYYLQDFKFSYNSDNGVLQVVPVFCYTMKKHYQ